MNGVGTTRMYVSPAQLNRLSCAVLPLRFGGSQGFLSVEDFPDDHCRRPEVNIYKVFHTAARSSQTAHCRVGNQDYPEIFFLVPLPDGFEKSDLSSFSKGVVLSKNSLAARSDRLPPHFKPLFCNSVFSLSRPRTCPTKERVSNPAQTNF